VPTLPARSSAVFTERGLNVLVPRAPLHRRERYACESEPGDARVSARTKVDLEQRRSFLEQARPRDLGGAEVIPELLRAELVVQFAEHGKNRRPLIGRFAMHSLE
jgi:hypothetical protein